MFTGVLRLPGMTPTVQAAGLTPREQDVIALMALGRSNAGICEDLFISPKTLETHVQRIFWKLDLLPMVDCHRRVCAVLAWLGAPAVTDAHDEADGLEYASAGAGANDPRLSYL